MTGFTKPFDALSNKRGSKIVVELKNQSVYEGNLECFDIHLNLVVSNAKILLDKKEEEVGTILIRGDTITIIKGLN